MAERKSKAPSKKPPAKSLEDETFDSIRKLLLDAGERLSPEEFEGLLERVGSEVESQEMAAQDRVDEEEDEDEGDDDNDEDEDEE